MKNPHIDEYRDLIISVTRFPKRSVPEGTDRDIHLYTHLNTMWNENLPMYHIDSLKETQKKQKDKVNEPEMMLYTSAAGLSTYGRKDVLFFLLFDISSVGRLLSLRKILNKILPLPDELTDLTKSIEILEWLKEHYDELQWNDNKGLFYLKNGDR